MSKEIFRNPTDLINHDRDRDSRIALIEDFSRQVDEKLIELNWQKDAPSNPDEAIEALTLSARTRQLDMLSQYVFEISEHEDDDEPLNLDDTRLLANSTFGRPDYFPPQEHYMIDAVKEGEQQGVEDFLELLVPSNIHLESPGTYFSPWRKDLLRRRAFITDNSDGSAMATLRTRLPNIGVRFYYQADSNFPERFIVLIRESSVHSS